jgi:hypothetical protein
VDVIGAGALVLSRVLARTGADHFTASEHAARFAPLTNEIHDIAVENAPVGAATPLPNHRRAPGHLLGLFLDIAPVPLGGIPTE